MIDFKQFVNPDRIRNMVRDQDELNVLLNNEEQYSDEEIYDAAEYAQDEIYGNFPALMNMVDFPKIAISYMVIHFLASGVSHQELRNQMRIDDDNVGNIDYSNKFQQYTQIAEIYKQKAFNLIQTYLAGSYYRGMWGENESNSYLIEGNQWQ